MRKVPYLQVANKNISLQDILGLVDEARMNVPGTALGIGNGG
jgi:4-alpha-glucanotransferase